jgi:dihydrofolate synthase/folylpolyglutamate synthase
MRPGGSVAQALGRAAAMAARGDRILVFGSFHTVGPALEYLLAAQAPGGESALCV